MKSEFQVHYFLFLFFFILPHIFVYAGSDQKSTPSTPEVNITLPELNSVFHWGDQVRYRITVSDMNDGDSRFGEIIPLDVFLETNFVADLSNTDISLNTVSPEIRDNEGLYLMRKSTCFGCHADKTVLVGPSFSDISDRYTHNPEILTNLANRIVHGSSGNWGEIAMPPHHELSVEEAEKITAYILEQGNRKDSWVYPGLEGVFRIIDKPEGANRGHYLLTASYKNNAQEPSIGRHTIVIEIR
jgi:cytochrome c